MKEPFQPGHPRLGGRRKGVRDKLSLAVLNDLLQVWQESARYKAPCGEDVSTGIATLRITAREDPAAFARLYASLLPKEIDLTNDLADIPDERIDAVIACLDARIADELARASGGTGEAGERKDQARKLN